MLLLQLLGYKASDAEKLIPYLETWSVSHAVSFESNLIKVVVFVYVTVVSSAIVSIPDLNDGSIFTFASPNH